MQRILLIFLLGIFLIPAQAQEDFSFAPKAGDKQVNLLLGKGLFYTNSQYNLYIDQKPTSIDVNRPSTYLNISDPNYNSIGNMIGVELKYFVTDAIAVSFNGAGYISTTPSRDGEKAVSTLPAKNAVESELGSRVAVSLAGQYYFNVSNERINPYAGVQGTFQFASLSVEQAFNPADPSDVGYGPRTGQMFGWSPALVAGIEYSILPGMIVGFEVKPVSFYYSGINLFAQPGMEAMSGQSSEYSFFSQPRFKVGFRF